MSVCVYSLKITILHNLLFFCNSSCHITQEFFQIWNLAAKSFGTLSYMIMFDKFYLQGHYKVMANFDIDGDMTLKQFLLTIQVSPIPRNFVAISFSVTFHLEL